MKITKLSTITALLVSGLSASGLSLYEDPITKQVFTEPGEGRIKLGKFVDEMTVKDSLKEGMSKESGTKLSAKAKKLKFHGRHYLGYTFRDYDDSTKQDSGKFETRRNYFQVKAYFDDKSYARVTLDTHNINDGKDVTGGDLDGTWNVRLKYAYAWLADVLPYTGVEVGQAHRPWIDYEEHNGWWYRHINKVYIEDGAGAHLINSADIGVNFKTKTDYFTSELALMNGEGYHANDGTIEDFDLSFEWRLTANVMGNGTKKMNRKKDTYLNLSFLGVMSDAHNKSSSSKPTDFEMYGFHAVYNNPMFLLAAQYISADDEGTKYDGDGFSLNGTFRPTKDISLIARYDNWEATRVGGDTLHDGDMDTFIYGVGYQYNKYVEFVANAKMVENEYVEDGMKGTADYTDYMLTAYVKW